MLPLTKPVKGFGNILCGLQALNPDALDTKGEWWAKLTPPFLFPNRSRQNRCIKRVFRRQADQVFGLVAQGIERPPPKRQVDGSNPSGVTRPKKGAEPPLRPPNLRPLRYPDVLHSARLLE